jgi:hypothetical protein
MPHVGVLHRQAERRRWVDVASGVSTLAEGYADGVALIAGASADGVLERCIFVLVYISLAQQRTNYEDQDLALAAAIALSGTCAWRRAPAQQPPAALEVAPPHAEAL